MILISEISHPGEIHLEANSSLVEILSLIYRHDQIIFRAEARHVDAVRRYVIDERIHFVRFKEYYNPKAFSWSTRIFGEIREVYRSLKLGVKTNSEMYVWTCIFPTGQFFLSLYLLFFNKKKIGHLIVLHGELEFLRKKKRKKTEVLLGALQSWAMKLTPENVRYIVLGESIKHHLLHYLPERVLKRVITMVHPYHYSFDNVANDFQIDAKPILFGAIGTQMLTKNSNFVFRLASYFKEEVLAGDLKFVTIGKVLPEISPYENELVVQLYANSFVPQSIFESEVRKLNFVLFFYDSSSYQLCASGAIFEVIKSGIPVISICNEYFKWLFAEFGELGFLCEDLNEMQNLITRIMKGELSDEIISVRKNIIKFKEQNSIRKIAAELSNKLCTTNDN